MIIAFDHGGDRPETPHRLTIEVPHRIADGLVVGVDAVVAEVAMPGEVELLHALDRDGCKVSAWVELMVLRTHIDVVDVEQDEAVRLLGHGAEKLPLAHLRGVIAQITRHVLEEDAPAEKLLHRPDTPGDVPHRLLGVGQGHEVVEVDRAHPGPAQVIRYPDGFDAYGERLERLEVSPIERIGPADGQRHPVHGHGVVCADAVEVIEGFAAAQKTAIQ